MMKQFGRTMPTVMVLALFIIELGGLNRLPNRHELPRLLPSNPTPTKQQLEN
jgi:hypothetical protein